MVGYFHCRVTWPCYIGIIWPSVAYTWLPCMLVCTVHMKYAHIVLLGSSFCWMIFGLGMINHLIAFFAGTSQFKYANSLLLNLFGSHTLPCVVTNWRTGILVMHWAAFALDTLSVEIIIHGWDSPKSVCREQVVTSYQTQVKHLHLWKRWLKALCQAIFL